LKGKFVVLEFWATWCEACVEDIPHLNDLEGRFQGQGVQFLSVTDEPQGLVEEFLKKHPISGWVGLDPDGSALRAFKVRGRPRTVILDRAGRVVGETYPTLLTESMLASILKGEKVALTGVGVEDRSSGAPALASARISVSSNSAPGYSMGPDRLDGRAMPLLNVLEAAYDAPSSRVELGPGIDPAAAYDYEAQVPLAASEDLQPLLQGAVQAGLGLKIGWQERTAEVLVLKGRPSSGGKLSPAKSKTSMTLKTGQGSIQATGFPLSEALKNIEQQSGKPIVDETGFKEKVDLSLEWSPAGDAKAMAAAVRDQWGLTLEPGRRKVRFLKVEKR
jgi:uncharacterized protein (TIGR03435 family)